MRLQSDGFSSELLQIPEYTYSSTVVHELWFLTRNKGILLTPAMALDLLTISAQQLATRSGEHLITDFACNFGQRRYRSAAQPAKHNGLMDLDRAWLSAASRRNDYSRGLLHSFFGVGAIIVGILAGLNVAGPVLSLIAFWLFRPAAGPINSRSTVWMKSTR